jgi:hypothetical protein
LLAEQRQQELEGPCVERLSEGLEGGIMAGKSTSAR